MKNEDLKELYNEGITPTFSSFEEALAILHMRDDWEGKFVLEIGCGKGDLCALLEMASAHIRGIDYAQGVIDKAEKKYSGGGKLFFSTADYRDVSAKYDIVIMQGVLEHFDEPFTELKWILDNLVADKGTVITSSPCFINPRGYIWMTIEMLFDIKMSLTDLHTINPWDMTTFCEQYGYELTVEYTNHDWACGEKLIIDFQKRLKSDIFKEKFKKSIGRVLKDDKIDKFLKWLINALQAEEFANLGANAIYEIGK